MTTHTIELFREKVKTRMYLMVAVFAVIFVTVMSFFIYEFTLPDNDVNGFDAAAFFRGFSAGAFVSILIFIGIAVYKCHSALKNDEKLREMFIVETDERMNFIKSKSGTDGFWISTLTLLISAVIASFINTTVCVTLYAAVVFIYIIQSMLRIYNSTKY